MKTNLLEFDKLIEIIYEHDIDLIRFIPFRKHTFANDPIESEKEEISNVEPDVLDEIIKSISNKINELKLKGISVTIPASFINKGISSKKGLVSKDSCCIPYFNYRIKHDGEIESCIRDNRGKIGNFFNDEIKTITKNRDLFRKTALSGQCNIAICATNAEIPDII